MFVWLVVLALLVYSFINSCRHRHFQPTGNTRRVNPPSYPGGGTGGGNGGPFRFTPSGPPPPYSKDPPASGAGGDAWRPGFWTGAALGAFANHIWNRNTGGQSQSSPPRVYDWERERMGPFQASPRRRPMSGFSSYEDRGEGPSSLGAMRTSTGYGGSRSR